MKPRRVARTARRLYRFCRVDGRLDPERTTAVARRLAATPRRGSLAVLQELERLVRLDQQRHRAQIASAVPLPQDVRADVVRRLARAYGAHVAATFVEDPSLIGGLRVRIGSDVYDGSVRAKLQALESRL
jgi:F-type H+-transporting ATPase subunit delta